MVGLRYYFVDGHSLNDRPRLAQVVAEELEHLQDTNSGKTFPSADEILDFLNGDEGRQEIQDALVTLQQLGVHGIPKFIIDGHLMVDGAAHSNVFVRIFREIERAGKLEGGKGPVFGDILGVSPDIIQQGSHHVPSSAQGLSAAASS